MTFAIYIALDSGQGLSNFMCSGGFIMFPVLLHQKYILCLTRRDYDQYTIFLKVNVGVGSDTLSWGTKGQLHCLG